MSTGMLRFVTAVLPLAACFGFASPCSAQLGADLVSNTVARQLGLERMWSTQLRVDPARGRVKYVTIHRGLLVAQTDRGTVQAVDAETGRTYWVAEVGRANALVQQPAVNDKYVAAINGGDLFVLDRSTGAIRWQQRLGNSPATGPAMSAERVFVPLDGGHVESYKLERERILDNVPDRFSGTGGATQPPLAVANRVLWTSTNGYVYSREQTKELIQFRFRMNDEGAGTPAYLTPFVYAASRAGVVYCLNEVTGLDVWHLAVGQSISQPLVALEGMLFAITETGDMVRIDPLAGRQVWYIGGIANFLSASAKRLYVTDLSGRLTVLDTASGARLGSLEIPGLTDFTIRNTASDRIYLATATGMLQCLREITQPKPIEHVPGFAIAPKPKEGAAPATPADGSFPTDGSTPAAPATPAADNPFGS
jgi:outer membrane protein assembly factor BamB